MLYRLYEKIILRHPIMALIVVGLVAVVLISRAPNIQIDASSDSLVLEDDDDIRYHQMITSRYQDGNFLIITYQPQQDILHPETLNTLAKLQQELETVPIVDHVTSILNVPLIQSPLVPLNQIGNSLPSIETQPSLDLELVRREFLESPIYRELLLSKTGDTTALLVYLKENTTLNALLAERNALRTLKYNEQISAEEKQRLITVQQKLRTEQTQYGRYESEQIELIRQILKRYRSNAKLFLGGVPMIVADIITFIKNDITIFSIAVILFLIITLSIIFRRLRWVLIPMSICLLTTGMMLGLLSWLDWYMTVISANFVLLLLITTMSINIHLSVYYREQQARQPDLSRYELVDKTVRYMKVPCFYMVLTTMLAFISLIVSGIRPVIDFGYIMALGIGLAFVLSFILFPAWLLVLKRTHNPLGKDFSTRLTSWCSRFTEKHPRIIFSVTLPIIAASLLGIAQLDVENRFIDYFKKDTEIYRGMLTLDRKLGGTTPLDLILKPAHVLATEATTESEPITQSAEATKDAPAEENDAFLDDYLSETKPASTEASQNNHWFTPLRLQEIKKIHQYLESRPEIGKVLSIATLIKVTEQLNQGLPLNDFEASLLPKLLPNSINTMLLDPFFFEESGELRFNMRIIDSDESLRRNVLLEEITHDLKAMGYSTERFRLTNMLVLYNNMLQSLFHSQIVTLLTVFLVIMLLFMILFRSFLMSLIAIIPNLVSAGLILGIMGWANIPLDILTITIAAITIGISVDNTIHYIVRFRKEFPSSCNYVETMHRCHNTIGRAIYYTSAVIVVGFSLLTFSNFVPNAYFGMLTGMALCVALIGTLLLLPALIILLRPLGPERIPTQLSSPISP